MSGSKYSEKKERLKAALDERTIEFVELTAVNELRLWFLDGGDVVEILAEGDDLHIHICDPSEVV